MPTIPNTTITEIIANEKLTGYRIVANPGYVLHDKNYDTEVMDEETFMPTGEILLGYMPSGAPCGVLANYNFNATTIIDGYTAYGNREFFARPQSEVPANQIFTLPGGGNDHEVM